VNVNVNEPEPGKAFNAACHDEAPKERRRKGHRENRVKGFDRINRIYRILVLTFLEFGIWNLEWTQILDLGSCPSTGSGP
jgi:hypothetical protein